MPTTWSWDRMFGYRMELVVVEVLNSVLKVGVVFIVAVIVILGVIQTLSLILVINLLRKCEPTILEYFFAATRPSLVAWKEVWVSDRREASVASLGEIGSGQVWLVSQINLISICILYLPYFLIELNVVIIVQINCRKFWPDDFVSCLNGFSLVNPELQKGIDGTANKSADH